MLPRDPDDRPAALVLAASFVTVLEFPVYFADVVTSTPLGVSLLVVRNGLLLAAALTAAVRLWRSTVPGRAPDADPVPDRAARTSETAPASP